MRDKFSGTGVALVTPLDAELNVDFPSLEDLIAFVLNGGVDYLVVQGTTGESATMTEKEKNEILKTVNDLKNNRPVVFGIGGNNTNKILEQFDLFNPELYDAVLSVCPYYNKPSQAGLIKHFTLIADKSPRPVILYNVPGRTSVNLTAASVIELSKHKNIIGIKEASGDFSQCISIVKQTGKDFLLISGDDLLTVPLLSIGASGVISVIANGLPSEMSQLVKYGLNNQFDKASKILHSIADMNQLMFKEGNPTGIKGLLAIMNICDNYVRPPLVEASENLQQEIKKLYDAMY